MSKIKGVIDRYDNSTTFAYTEDELEFMKAIEQYRKKNHIRYLSWVQVLEIAKSLGYTKVTVEKVTTNP